MRIFHLPPPLHYPHPELALPCVGVPGALPTLVVLDLSVPALPAAHWDTLGHTGSQPRLLPFPSSTFPVPWCHAESPAEPQKRLWQGTSPSFDSSTVGKKKKNQRNFLIRAGLGTKRVCPSRAGNVTFAGSWCQTGAAGERRCLAGLGASAGPTLTQWGWLEGALGGGSCLRVTASAVPNWLPCPALPWNVAPPVVGVPRASLPCDGCPQPVPCHSGSTAEPCQAALGLGELQPKALGLISKRGIEWSSVPGLS